MAPMSRREFFRQAATDAAVAGFLAAAAPPLRANPLGLPIGSQTYPHRPLLKDLVIAFVPILNADGNERMNPANRPHQPGPAGGVGVWPITAGVTGPGVGGVGKPFVPYTMTLRADS